MERSDVGLQQEHRPNDGPACRTLLENALPPKGYPLFYIEPDVTTFIVRGELLCHVVVTNVIYFLSGA